MCVRPLIVVVSLFAAVILARAQNQAADLEVRESLEGTYDRSGPVRSRRSQPLPRPLRLERLLPFTIGTPLKLSDVRIAIQKLYDTGRYADVSITGEADAPGAPGGRAGVAIHIATRFNFFVTSVSIDGASEPPTKGQLTTAAKLELGTLFEDKQLVRSRENMEERLRANGLYHGTVTHSVERDPATEEAQIHFYIDAWASAWRDSTASTVNRRWRRPTDREHHSTSKHGGGAASAPLLFQDGRRSPRA